MSRLSSDEERKWEIEGLKQACEGSFAAYLWLLLDKGRPRELARMVLPLNTYSHMFAKVNLLNLLNS